MIKEFNRNDFVKNTKEDTSIKSKFLKNINHEPKKTRITFITPNVIGSSTQIRRAQPPLGIACLAAVLEEFNFKNLQIIDSSAEGYNQVRNVEKDFIEFGLNDEIVISRLKKFNPDIIGISALFSFQFLCAERLAKKIKNELQNSLIVFGGIHASKMYESLLIKNSFIDYIICGEADYSFAIFCNNFENKIDLKKTPSLAYRDEKNLEKINKNTELPGLDMNELPLPAWHLLNIKMYWDIGMPHNPFMKSKKFLTVMTQRGCPEKCYFCSSGDFFGNSGKFRSLNPEKAFEMIEYAVKKYGIKELQIEDDTFALNSKRVIEFCKKIKKFNLRIILPNNIRADAPKNKDRRLEMFKHMSEAGFDKIGVSAEHGDQEFLDRVIGKRLNLEEVVATIDLAHKSNIMIHTNFMMGFPFETKENRDKTINFAKSLKADSFSVSLVTPLPGTKLYNICKKHNLFMPDFNISRLVYDRVSIIPHDISADDLLKLVSILNKELNTQAIKNNPKLENYYSLIDGKNINDRKYSREIKKMALQKDAHGSVVPK